MEFSLFLSCYHPDTGRSSAEVYRDMLDMAQAAERLGYCGLTLPEHHFMNILMNPSPLMLAVKVASVTSSLPITASVVVLPLNDMRRLAGELALADILTDGRIQIGVGRGAFPYEFARFGVDFDKGREIFDESLDVLQALLTGQEVAWDGQYYKFAPMTVMPRPVQRPYPPIWIAAMAPDALYHSAKRGFNIQTTPLQGSLARARTQVESFMAGAEASGREPRPRLSLLRVGFCTRDEAHTREVLGLAHGYYRRFMNVHVSSGNTVGTIENGSIKQIEIDSTPEDLGGSNFIGTAERLIEKLQAYADMGVDEINLNMCLGASHGELLDSMERFAAEVMPHFAGSLRLSA